jgi:ATP-binding cassette subfamily B protein
MREVAQLIAPKLLSSVTGIVESGVKEEGLHTIGLLTAALLALQYDVSV